MRESRVASDKLAVRFVGVHVSFPVEKGQRRVNILRRFLSLEDKTPFKKIVSSSVLGKSTKAHFSGPILEDVLQLLEIGAKDTLSLLPYWSLEDVLQLLEIGAKDTLSLLPYWRDEEWIKTYEDSPHVTWYSSWMEPVHKEVSPLRQRFGWAGNLILEYPVSRFAIDSPSPFQDQLIELIKKLAVEEEIYSAFIHQGYKPIEPAIIGNDYVFSQTRDKFPLTMFDDLIKPVGFFKEYLKGAFWANFLNPIHVEKLGGISRVRGAKPCSIVEELGGGWVLLQVGASPLKSNEARAVEEYQRLRRFLKPILLETEDDVMRIQREINGPWKPPKLAAQHWRNFVAHRKKMDS